MAETLRNEVSVARLLESARAIASVEGKTLERFALSHLQPYALAHANLRYIKKIKLVEQKGCYIIK